MTNKLTETNKTKSFCALAWNEISVSPTGTLTPCCLFEKTINKPDGSAYRIYESEFNEVINSEFMKEIRLKMLNGEKIDACNQCYKSEETDGFSMRIQANLDYQNVISKELKIDNLKVRSIDLKLNNKCNLKCRMCQPKDSNLIYNEFKKIHDKDLNFSSFQNTSLKDPELHIDLKQIQNWEDHEAFHEKLSRSLPYLQKISVVGGEPLLLDSLYKILDQAVASGFSKSIYLIITTNLVMVPFEKINNYFGKFSKILFNISLDATGKELQYLRYPTKFEKVVDNFKRLYELSKNDKKTHYQFSLTAQAYNALYFCDIFEFAEKLVSEGYYFQNAINFTYLTYPEHLNLNILPQNIRAKAISKLQIYKEKSLLYEKYPQFKIGIDQLINILSSEIPTNALELQESFLYYTNTLDKERGQRFKDFMPELYQGFIDANIEIKEPTPSFHMLRDRGWELSGKGDLENAIKYFEKSILTSDNKDLDLREMAWMNLSLKNYEKSFELYEKAIVINQEDKHILKGFIFSALSLNKTDKAKKFIKKALLLNPNDQELISLKNSNPELFKDLN